jgi:hypothetical protein
VHAYVQLAARRHGHLHISPAVLLDAFEVCTDDRLLELDALTNYIGGTNPEMSSHTVVAAQFVWPLWEKGEPEMKAQKATSMIIEKLLRGRHGDWAMWFSLLMHAYGSNPALRSYLYRWLIGHFLRREPVEVAFQTWRRLLRR